MIDSLIYLREASKIMGCSYTKAHRLAKAGELPFKKLGSTWVIPRSVLYECLGLKFDTKERANEHIHS